MAEETVVNPNQPARTETGAIADQSQAQNQTTTQQTTTEQKPAIEAPKSKDGLTLLSKTEPETKTEPEKKEGDEPKTGAPEKYEDYKLPEGYKLLPEAKAQADAVFKELDLNQEGAQKLVDLYQSQVKEALEAPVKAYQDLAKSWADESLAHPDLKGKLGPGKEITVKIAKFIDNLPDKQLASDFRGAMDLTLVGNHPAFIRVMNYVASQLSEGTHVSGNGPSKAGQSAPGTAPPSTAAALWPNLPSNRTG